MAKAIKLADKLVDEAKAYGNAMHRSAPKQLEYWARLGKIAEENPDLTFNFVKDMLIGLEEQASGSISEYKFG